MSLLFLLRMKVVGVGAALVQSGTDTVPGLWTLITYLVPAGVALALVIAVIIGRRRRRKRGGEK